MGHGALALAFGAAAVIIVGAVLLRASAKWVAGEDVPFSTALGTTVLIWVVHTVVGFVIGLAVGAAQMPPIMAQGLSLLVGFLIASGIISAMLGLSFGTAALVTLVMYLIGVAIVVVVGAVVLLGVGLMR